MSNWERFDNEVAKVDLSTVEKMSNFINGMLDEIESIAKKTFEYIKETKPEKLDFGVNSKYEDWHFHDDDENIIVYYTDGHLTFGKFIMPLEAVGEELYKDWANENI